LYLNYDQSKQEIESLNEKYFLLDESHKTLTQEFANFKTDSQRKIVEAYDTGYGKGSQEGYQEGYLKGYSQGNETGTEIGYQTGFEEGLEVGARGDYEGWGCFVRDPTYAEVLKFISEDKTDKMEYIEGEFVCHDFAYMFKNNAYQKGYRCFYVHIGLLDGGHAIVGFNSTDRGMMYIEPQNDYFVELEVGKNYWTECVILPPGYHYYESPSYNDTIVHFKVYW